MEAPDPAELTRICHAPLDPYVKPGDQVLIATDPSMEEAIPKALFDAAREIGAEPTIVVFPTRPAPHMEPTRAAAAAMKNVDVVAVVTSHPFLHTESARAAVAAGVKFIGMSAVTLDTVLHGAATADPAELLAVTERVADLLTEARTARVTSALGTDVSMTLEGRRGHILVGSAPGGKSLMGGFPFGEAPIAPVEGTTAGTIVFDSTVEVLGTLSQPVTVRVEGGRITRIEGGADAGRLRELLSSKGDENSYVIAEFSIGTNPKARLTANMMEAKRIRGSVHFGLGDSASLGGTTRSVMHMDGLVLKPTVRLDGRVVVEDGVLKA